MLWLGAHSRQPTTKICDKNQIIIITIKHKRNTLGLPRHQASAPGQAPRPVPFREGGSGREHKILTGNSSAAAAA